LRRAAGAVELRGGEIAAALRHLEDSERAYQALGLEIPPLLRQEQAQVLLAAGLAAEAGRHLDDVLPILAGRRGSTRELAQIELLRAAALRTGDLDLARRTAAAARRRIRRSGCDSCVTHATIMGLWTDSLGWKCHGRSPNALSCRRTGGTWSGW